MAKTRQKSKFIFVDDIKLRPLKNYPGYSVSVRYKRDGKWKYSSTIKVKGSKDKAIAKGKELYLNYAEKENESIETVNQLIKEFIDTRQLIGSVSENTLKRDESILRRISKYLGKISLTDLTTKKIKDKYKKMRADGITDDALHKTHCKLKQMLNQAVDEEKLNNNPCNAIHNIKRPKKSQETIDNTRFTKEMYYKLLETLKIEPITSKTVVLVLAMNTGMRRGEILGLIWKYVHLNENNPYLEVNYSFSKERKLTPPKTPKSKRKIVLDSFTTEYLKNWKVIQEDHYERLGTEMSEDKFVCADIYGKGLDANNFNRWRRNYFVKLGFGQFTKTNTYTNKKGVTKIIECGYVGPGLHSLRHYHATILVASGLDPKTVQARLGHEKITTTLDIYAEALSEKDVEAAECINTLTQQHLEKL